MGGGPRPGGRVAAHQLGAVDRDHLIEVISALLAATVIARRKYPVQAFAVAAAIAAGQVAFGLRPQGGYAFGAWQPTTADLALAVLLYTLAAYRPRRVSLAGLVTCLVLAAVAIARWPAADTLHPQDPVFAAAAGLGGVILTAWCWATPSLTCTRLRTSPRSRTGLLGWRPSARPRRGSPLPPNGPENCRSSVLGRSMSRLPDCVVSSVTCTTVPRSGLSRSR